MGFIEKDDPQGIELPACFVNLTRAERMKAADQIAFENGTILANVCGVCLDVITVAIFRGTGVCCDDHRKIAKEERSNELLERIQAQKGE